MATTTTGGVGTGTDQAAGILYGGGGSPPGPAGSADGARPDYFGDLNLDQVVDAVVDGLEEYDLAPYFHCRLDDGAAVRYRQAVFADLERDRVHDAVASFAASMRRMRADLSMSGQVRHRWQRARWFLDAVVAYCGAVTELSRRLDQEEVRSAGLRDFGRSLAGYVRSPELTALAGEAKAVADALSAIRYLVHVRGSKVTVLRYAGEADYSAGVMATFERFRRRAAKDYRVGFTERQDMNHVETQILDRVARLFPEQFALLDSLCARHRQFADAAVVAFDRQAHFYLGYLRWTAPMRAAGLPFCYPEVMGTDGSGGGRQEPRLSASGAFDLALAGKLVAEGQPVVPNDVRLDGPERILVVSGPNQGGKTTFARMVGQLHHLAALGCPVPGTGVRLGLCDRIFTHFEREEDLGTAGGRLSDDLVRARRILLEATGDSVVVMNELFASTTLSDAAFLGRTVIDRLAELGPVSVYVTFVESLASHGPSTVSVVSTVRADDPSRRTYKVVRRPADGRAYAAAIAERHGLTYEQLRRRVQP